MGESWERRPKRGKTKHGVQRHTAFARRACCATFGRRPHTSSCRRDPEMCGVKTAYDYAREATSQAEAMASKTGLVWRGYHCPWCELWHLTTTVDREE